MCAASLIAPAISRGQDAAEAARQEKIRKGTQTKKSRHVYTNEDLRKKEILDPDDRAQVEARKKDGAPAPNINSAPQVDSDNGQATESLGEVARRYRAAKEAQQAEEALRKQTPSQFPMDIAQPALAHPVQPEGAAKKSPVGAPKFDMPRMGKIRDPFSRSVVPPRKPVAPLAPSFAITPRAIPVLPTAPKTPAISIVPNAANVRRMVTVKTGDSLWKISKQYLGDGSRWQELLSANPNLTVPTRVLPGTVLRIPTTTKETENSTSRMKIQKGDSLWKIALSHYGSGASWTCLAQANPSVRNPNEIFAGHTLLVPASCSLRR
jgi:nucleoid-associated protein YgaU